MDLDGHACVFQSPFMHRHEEWYKIVDKSIRPQYYRTSIKRRYMRQVKLLSLSIHLSFQWACNDLINNIVNVVFIKII